MLCAMASVEVAGRTGVVADEFTSCTTAAPLREVLGAVGATTDSSSSAALHGGKQGRRITILSQVTRLIQHKNPFLLPRLQ